MVKWWSGEITSMGKWKNVRRTYIVKLQKYFNGDMMTLWNGENIYGGTFLMAQYKILLISCMSCSSFLIPNYLGWREVLIIHIYIFPYLPLFVTFFQFGSICDLGFGLCFTVALHKRFSVVFVYIVISSLSILFSFVFSVVLNFRSTNGFYFICHFVCLLDFVLLLISLLT